MNQNLYVDVPKDIDEYERKYLFRLSGRQLFWATIALLLCGSITVSFYLMNMGDLGMFLGFSAAVGTFFFGAFKKWHGRSYPDFVKSIFIYYKTEQRLFYFKDIDFFKEDKNVKKTAKDKRLNKKYYKEFYPQTK